MAATVASVDLVHAAPMFAEPERLALAGFLASYTGLTREAYMLDLRQFASWCHQHSLALFAARRADIEGFARDLEARGRARSTVSRRLATIAGFYKYAVEEDLLDHSPAAHVRPPRLDYDSHAIGLDRNEVGALRVAAGLGSPAVRKGSKKAIIPLAPRTALAIDLTVGERCQGPIFLTAPGARLDRHGAARIVRRIAKRAGLTKPVEPNTLRHAFITAALDAGVPLRDVQEAASHADPRTTMRYDRARASLDRHATYIVAAYIAGAAR